MIKNEPRFSLRLDSESRKWATKRAEKNKRSLNSELNYLIEIAKEIIEKEETEKT